MLNISETVYEPTEAFDSEHCKSGSNEQQNCIFKSILKISTITIDTAINLDSTRYNIVNMRNIGKQEGNC